MQNTRYKIQDTKKGFTLIELLVVVAIIAVLSGIIVIAAQDAIDRARMARVKSWATTVQTELAGFEVGTWKFDEGAGTEARDTSWKGNHGTLHNFPTNPWVEGVFGNALEFDGSNDRVDVTHSHSLDVTTSYTLSLWIFPHIVNNHRMMLWRGSGNISDIEFYLRNTDTLILHNRGNGGVLTALSFSNPPANAWTHITVSYGGSLATWKVYYNGLEVSTTLLLGNGEPPLDSNFGWRMGDTDHTGFAHGGQFNGLIDEVRIYNRAFQAYEIQNRFVKGIESLLARSMITDKEFQERMFNVEH